MRANLLLLSFVLAAGCSAPPTQVITGRVAPDFPMAVTSVKVTTSAIQSWHGDAKVATAPVAADGTFVLDVQALHGLRLHLIGTGQSKVVFPRQTGTVDTSFAIRGHGADFDLGMIHYVGVASTTPFVFHTTTGGGTGGMQCDGDDHDSDGATCVDDQDDSNNTCGQDDHGDDNDQQGEHDDGDNNDQQGEHDDGGDDNNDQQGEHDDGDQQDGPDMGDAVAEHNFPADGCSDDHHHDDGDGESDDD